ncbi:Pam16-domain-containing protein, partial [Triangularia verruculosa]
AAASVNFHHHQPPTARRPHSPPSFPSPTLTQHKASKGCRRLLVVKMAYRLITQVVLIGTRVLGRSFAEAYKQAAASSAYQRAHGQSGNGTTGRASLSSGMTLDEACKILNVKPPQNGQANMEEVMERFKRLFDSNDPKKGGSFYLQSKILRARERIESEAGPHMEKAEQEAEIKEGWNPKLYKEKK